MMLIDRKIVLIIMSSLLFACKISVVEYYDNGNPAIKGYERNGKDCGIWSNFYPDGSIAAAGKLKHGKKRGVWKYYTEEKKLYQKIIHKINGYEIVSDFGIMPPPPKLPPNCTWKYYREGKLIKTEKYKNGKLVFSKIN